ncbi:MAG: hypothetical protein ACOYLF_18120, partial [Blastocatellia bacterium]
RHKGLRYVDVNPVLFDRNGQPRTELYLPDNLHFRDPAYTELAKIIKPAVASAWKEARSGQGNRIMRIPGK